MADAVVVLLRSPSSPETDDKYHKILSSKGFTPVSLAVLSFEFHNLDKLKDLLSQPHQHSGIILTSQRSVEALEIAVSSIGQSEWLENLKREWQDLHLFAVGDATTQSMNDKLGLSCLGREAGSAENLVPLIKEVFSMVAMKDNNNPLLFPCGNLTKETIPHEMNEAGINLQSVQVYRTCPHPDIKKGVLDVVQSKGNPSVLVFFSPSGLDYSLQILQDVLPDFANVKLVAIGNTTNKAMIDKGLPVAAVSKKPNPDFLCQCIEDCFTANHLPQ